MIIWILTVIYVLAVAFAVYFMYRYCDIPGKERNTQKPYVIFKMTASMIFILIATAAYLLSKNSIFFYLLPTALLCAGGDFFLALAHEIDNRIKNPQFLTGVLLFAAAHVLISVCYLSILHWRISWTCAIPFAVLIYTAICTKSRNYEYGNNALPCTLYGFFAGLSAALGLQLMITCPDNITYVFLGIGSILFFVSDSILSMKLFAVRKNRLSGAGVLFFYYVGMWFLTSAIAMEI